MTRFIIRRTIYALITLFILSLTIFIVVRLTGDPVSLLAEPGARDESVEADIQQRQNSTRERNWLHIQCVAATA